MSLEHADPATAEARAAVTADAVLDAALTLFAERGYHGTAVSQIAASLGIRTSSLYNHMRSKQDLLEAIIGRTMDGVLDDFRNFFHLETALACADLFNGNFHSGS